MKDKPFQWTSIQFKVCQKTKSQWGSKIFHVFEYLAMAGSHLPLAFEYLTALCV
jgi:hypothetical protein